ncbi:hypothetical protein ACIPNL_17345 [Curtobacterium sp. NPDC090221]
MAAGTIALTSVVLLFTIAVIAPIRAASAGVVLPDDRLATLRAAAGWPDYSLPWAVPAAIAFASLVVTVWTFCVGPRLRRGMWAPTVTMLLVTAAFLGVTTGLLYWGSPRWQHWQAVFALVPLLAAVVVAAVHVEDARRAGGTAGR